MTTSIQDRIDALKNNPQLKIELIRQPIKPKSDEWRDTAHEWLVIFPGGISTKYYTGLGHRTEKKQATFGSDRGEYQRLSRASINDLGLKALLRLSTANKPELEDILHSMAMDGTAADESFQDWCDNFGYDTDSLKAFNTYQACMASAKDVRALGFTISELNDHFQDR